MSEELICITCPMGCHLFIDRPSDGSLAVTGNRCPRGLTYAAEELLAPKRMVSATAAVAGPGSRGGPGSIARLPVRSSAAFPRHEVPELLAAIYSLRVKLPVARGDVLIRDFKGSGVDVIATRTLGQGLRRDQ
ncbi:MAG: molybdopterin oxidoreductase [Spirochaetae bacterium HGW-Spirochaetae-7]|jgi:CxxC motif-containing protein|nr:MAG: molybdopterin oxidoreductase [Spirochaetae bacterium HGW-Spirochaetae-7]